MFLVICSVFRITSSVLGKLELGAESVSSGMEPSPCQMTLRCRPFLPDLQGNKAGLARGQSTLLSPPSCVSSVTAPTPAPPAPRGWWGCHSRSQTRCSASPASRPARNRFTSACAGKGSPGLCQSHVLCMWICSLHNSSCSSCCAPLPMPGSYPGHCQHSPTSPWTPSMAGQTDRQSTVSFPATETAPGAHPERPPGAEAKWRSSTMKQEPEQW